jgi:endonuclease/exonuclease/phosphatase family metal-dependent hydrolase
MAIPPTNDVLGDQLLLGQAMLKVNADVIGVQEVDEKLERSGEISQVRLLAESMGAADWAFAPSVIGTPGFKWRAVNSSDAEIVTNKNSHTNDGAELVGGYGIGIASKVAVKHWDRIDLGRSVFGMPLIIPAEGKDGKQKAKPIYVADEPRVALAATLENGWTVINTHLSFVPFVNLYQLRKIKLWAKKLGKQYGTQVLIIGDLNLPKGIPALGSSWNSLITQNTYPSWGAKIQFDYILSNSLKTDQYEALDTVATGISDHLPIRVKIR